MPDWVHDLIKGSPAAIVALFATIIAGLIAWRQYKIAHKKLQLDLFDRRYKVFKSVCELLAAVIDSHDPAAIQQALGKYYADSHGKKFLFPDTILIYLETLRKNITKYKHALISSATLARQK